LTVKHDGFVQIERNFDLVIQQAGRIDLQMALSGATQTVDVQETNIGLETETSSLGQVVSARDLVSLPVSGRNPLALARLAPGVINSAFLRFRYRRHARGCGRRLEQ